MTSHIRTPFVTTRPCGFRDVHNFRSLSRISNHLYRERKAPFWLVWSAVIVVIVVPSVLWGRTIDATLETTIADMPLVRYIDSTWLLGGAVSLVTLGVMTLAYACCFATGVPLRVDLPGPCPICGYRVDPNRTPPTATTNSAVDNTGGDHHEAAVVCTECGCGFTPRVEHRAVRGRGSVAAG